VFAFWVALSGYLLTMPSTNQRRAANSATNVIKPMYIIFMLVSLDDATCFKVNNVVFSDILLVSKRIVEFDVFRHGGDVWLWRTDS